MPLDLTPFLNWGVAGIMLWWFAVRLENRMSAWVDTQAASARETAEALDRMTRANMLLLLEMEGLPLPHRRRAEALVKELDEAAAIREKGLIGGRPQ